MTPGEPIKLVESCLRSALFISKEGNMYRHYYDTKTWAAVLPRCSEDGKMCGYKNKSLQRLIAEAWLETPGVVTEKLRLPNVKVIDSEKSPHDADNLEWCSGRRCKNKESVTHLPPKLELLKEILEEEEEVESVEELSRMLGVRETTAWNYICKLLSSSPEMNLAEKAVQFVNESCLKLCLDHELKGTLTEAMNYVNIELNDDEEWQNEENKYSHLRIARMYCDILKF